MTVKEILAKCRTNERRAQELRQRLPTSLSRTHSQRDRHMLVWLPSKLDMCIEACRELLRAYERKVDLGHASLSDVVYATSELASIEIEWDTIETWLKGLDQAA